MLYYHLIYPSRPLRDELKRLRPAILNARLRPVLPNRLTAAASTSQGDLPRHQLKLSTSVGFGKRTCCLLSLNRDFTAGASSSVKIKDHCFTLVTADSAAGCPLYTAERRFSPGQGWIGLSRRGEAGAQRQVRVRSTWRCLERQVSKFRRSPHQHRYSPSSSRVAARSLCTPANPGPGLSDDFTAERIGASGVEVRSIYDPDALFRSGARRARHCSGSRSSTRKGGRAQRPPLRPGGWFVDDVSARLANKCSVADAAFNLRGRFGPAKRPGHCRSTVPASALWLASGGVTLSKLPRRMARPVIRAKQRSTRLSRAAPPGMKWSRMRTPCRWRR